MVRRIMNLLMICSSMMRKRMKRKRVVERSIFREDEENEDGEDIHEEVNGKDRESCSRGVRGGIRNVKRKVVF